MLTNGEDRPAASRRRWVAVATAAMLLPACSSTFTERTMLCSLAPTPPIALSPDGRTATTRLSVLTYNIEGLGWPARRGERARDAQLQEIGTRLAAMQAAGLGPDVTLFQEMFSSAAKKAVSATNYPALVRGPHRTTRPPADTAMAALPGKASIKRGEVGIHLVGSGLAIGSRYPIVQSDVRAFGRRSCAGLDCLSNKGVVLARILIPGVPGTVDVYGTHMNSSRASRVPAARHLAAHSRQSREIGAFLSQTRDPANPVIFGGDFNMRQSDRRWSQFSRHQALRLVHRVCARPGRCDVRMSWDGDAPWMDTQDLQFFTSGTAVSIRPLRVEAMFDGGPSGPALSDHDGFLVTYELAWPTTLRGNRC